jgi:hypothetical protein
LVRLKKDNEAKNEYGKVRGIWGDGQAVERRIRDSYPGEDEAQKDKRVAKALNAVGEAYFYSAEEQRKTGVEPIKFPEYKGAGSKEEVLKHIKTKVKDWYEKKKEAITKAQPEYVKILELKPVPPPKWVIAAGSRTGLMWGNFVDDFRRAPIPESFKKDAEIRGAYYDSLDAASEPFKVKLAKPALEKCLKLSVQFQYFDEFSRECELWLAKNYKAEYHVVDELRGAPTLSNSGLDDRTPPLNLGGQMWHPVVAQPANEASKASSDEDKGDKASSSTKGTSSAAPKARPAAKAAARGRTK